MKSIYLYIFLLSMVSCKRVGSQDYSDVVNAWLGRKIQFSEEALFVGVCEDSMRTYVPHITEYAILTYINSEGCFSCKLQLPQWENLMNELSSLNLSQVPVLFIFNPDDKQALISLLRKVKFDYPVYIDTDDVLNQLNKFPTEMEFQTFLLDKEARVVAMGNPILNPKVKNLYLKIMTGNIDYPSDDVLLTTVEADRELLDFGQFPKSEKQKRSFFLTNTGNRVLVIHDVVTSCGCTRVEYSKEGVRPGGRLELKVIYDAEEPGRFSKTITVYCNAESSPLRLKIRGEAE